MGAQAGCSELNQSSSNVSCWLDMELLKIHLSQTNGLLLLTLPFTVCQLHPHVLKLNLLYLELNLLLFLTPLQKQVQCHPPPFTFTLLTSPTLSDLGSESSVRICLSNKPSHRSVFYCIYPASCCHCNVKLLSNLQWVNLFFSHELPTSQVEFSKLCFSAVNKLFNDAKATDKTFPQKVNPEGQGS